MAEIAFMVFSLGLLMRKKARPSFVYLSLQSMKGRKISKGSLSDFLDSISFQMSESQFKKSFIYRRHIIQLNKVLILSLLCTRFRIGGIKQCHVVLLRPNVELFMRRTKLSFGST